MKQQITMTKQKNLTSKEAFDLFLRKCKVRNLSEQTLKTYQEHFEIWSKFYPATKHINRVTAEIIENFILHLHDTDIRDVTINSYLRTIRVFLYYCMECSYVEHFKITMIKADKKVKETYTEDELKKLLEKPDTNKCSFTEYKTWVFENYLLGTGNRISSALNLQICDIDFENMLITLRKTKNRKQQIIPLSVTLADILKEYLEVRGGELDDYLFCNIYGEQGSRRTFQQLVYRYNIKRGVNKTSCHLFRATYAKIAILNGIDPFRLQKLMGHSDLTVTREYVNMFTDDLQLDYEKFNPLDNINKHRGRIKM